MTESKPFWQPKGTVSVRSAKVVEVADWAPASVFCEFVGDKIDPICEGRYCFDGAFCPASCFKDPIIFARCTFRLEKLKSSVGT